jgi:hypothetical protein
LLDTGAQHGSATRRASAPSSKSFENVAQQQGGSARAFLKIADACVSSRSIARLPDEKNEADDQDNDNQHPGLHLDAENVERLNEELLQSAPLYYAR